MKIPLVLPNLKFNQRNYFDCFESSFGGMLAYYINDYDFILSLYCIPDAVSLYINQDTSEIKLNSRSLDINSFAIENLGFTLIGNSNLDNFNLRSTERPFVVCFDEYYVKENNHYRKKHFSHASLGIEIIDLLHIKVSDPELKIPFNLQSYNERIITFDESINSQPDSVLFYLLERKEDFIQLDPNELTKKCSTLNIDIWKNRIPNNQNINAFFGLQAIDVFNSQLKEFNNLKTASGEFYKWIFPIYWKRKYLQSFNDDLSKEICTTLTAIIKGMEIFETNLLRLISHYKKSLFLASVERWEKITDELKKYVNLEEERVHKRYP